MKTRRTWLAWAAVLLGLSVLARPATAQNCNNGPEGGQWDLPQGSVDGSLDGTLTGAAGTTLYHFTATLHDIPTACLSCVHGSIDGTLADLVGGGPTLSVHGFYSGLQLTGSGTFRAEIYKPGPTPASAPVLVGRMRGNFHDPLGTQPPGTFSGHWAICM
jgi:hypothetical protein